MDPQTAAELTSAEVRQVSFGKPPWGKRGYHDADVDAFLQLAAGALDGVGTTITPEQAHNVIFRKPPVGKRGYDERQVDSFLDRVERQLRLNSTRSS